MKMFYITATKWDRSTILCKETTLETYGYDGFDMEVDLSFEDKKDTESYRHEIVLLTANQVESILKFKEADRFDDDKSTVLSNCAQKWRDVLKETVNIEVKEVILSF